MLTIILLSSAFKSCLRNKYIKSMIDRMANDTTNYKKKSYHDDFHLYLPTY